MHGEAHLPLGFNAVPAHNVLSTCAIYSPKESPTSLGRIVDSHLCATELQQTRFYFPFRTSGVQIIAIWDRHFVFWRGILLGNLFLLVNLFYDYWETIRKASLLFLSLPSDTSSMGQDWSILKQGLILLNSHGLLFALLAGHWKPGDSIFTMAWHFKLHACVENQEVSRQLKCWNKI